MPFTLRNLKEDLEDLGSNFDGAPDLEFRIAVIALSRRVIASRRMEKSAISGQSHVAEGAA